MYFPPSYVLELLACFMISIFKKSNIKHKIIVSSDINKKIFIKFTFEINKIIKFSVSVCITDWVDLKDLGEE